MKALFTFFLAVTVFSVSAQDGVIVKYFDSLWSPTSKEKAVYYTQFIKEDTLYKCTSYFAKSNQVYGKSTYGDTMFSNGKGRGLMLRYYESGILHDSTLFDMRGLPIYRYSFYENKNLELKDFFSSNEKMHTIFHFFENGKLMAHLYYDSVINKSVTEGFDESGTKIPNYIYQKEAEFSGGPEAWTKYLIHNLRNNVPVKHKAPMGKYSVTVVFLVDKEGAISNAYPENDPGFGTKEEAMRIIKNSPKWTPAIWLNKLVNYRAKQKITFVVQE